MKKSVSIFLASLMLLTGIHLSIASHFCGGELAAVKISITDKNASCGMEGEPSNSFPTGNIIKKHCCENDLTTLSVDSNYSPSFPDSNNIFQKIVQLIEIPISIGLVEPAIIQFSQSDKSPPGTFRKNSVDLTAICVFRI